MPDIAKERGGIPLGGEVRAPLDAGQPEATAPLFTVHLLSRDRLDEATRMLDGIGGLGWSVIGFVVGAIFWHFIGFWGFVADVVLAGGPSPAREQLAWSAPRSVVASAAMPSCTTLVLDRRSGLTSARPCEGVLPPLPADTFQGREDRVAVAD